MFRVCGEYWNTLGLYGYNGKENGNYYSRISLAISGCIPPKNGGIRMGGCRDYIGVILSPNSRESNEKENGK